MARFTVRDFAMPTAAFGMIFVLGSVIYSSIGHAKLNAQSQREKMYAEIRQQREDLGMDLPAGRKLPGQK